MADGARRAAKRGTGAGSSRMGKDAEGKQREKVSEESDCFELEVKRRKNRSTGEDRTGRRTHRRRQRAWDKTSSAM